MKFRHVAIAVLCAPSLVLAADKITFQGEVTNQTCEAQVNGQSNGLVLLPAVQSTALTSSGSTAGLTPFTVSISDCAAPVADANVTTNFLGSSVSAAGNLKNMASSDPAGRVQLQLMTKGSGGTAVVLNGVTPVAGLVLPAGQTSTSHTFGVQYISEEGGATAGAVQSSVEYSLSYN